MPENRDQNLPDLRYVRELAKVFRNYGLDEIEIDTGEQRILLRRGGQGHVQTIAAPALPQAAAPVPTPAPAPEGVAAAATEAGGETGEFITSPFVGTFFSAPRPDADTFIKVGAQVKAGDTVCIVEAMKLFNEIEAEFPCVVEEILVDNATPVEFGAKLFRIKRL